MKALYRQLLLPITLFATGNCYAEWTGGVEGGATSGEKPTFRFFANKDADPLSHYLYLDWIRESGGSNYRIGYNPTFKVSHSIYSFGRFSIEQDDPGEVEREIDALVGVGNNLFKRGKTQVKVETGVGGRLLKFNGNEDETDGFFFLSGNITTSLLSLLRFDASVNTKAGSDQTTLDGEAGFSIPVGPATSLRYVYTVKRYNRDNAENIVSEDTSFKLSYGF